MIHRDQRQLFARQRDGARQNQLRELQHCTRVDAEYLFAQLHKRHQLRVEALCFLGKNRLCKGLGSS